MARQQAHNRRAGRGGGGSSWISYSDIMAGLVMVFVLFLVYSLYNYGTQIRIQEAELERARLDLGLKEDELAAQTIILLGKQQELDSKNAELKEIRIALGAKEGELAAQTIILIGKQQELDEANISLKAQKKEIERMQGLLSQKSEELTALVGVRPEIIRELSDAMSANRIPAVVDQNGNITLGSSVFFDVNSADIRADGKTMLNQFLPVYLEVLMQPKYSSYVGEIIIEGHTDSSGTYLKNLRLSQNRALAVAEYCLTMYSAGHTEAEVERLQSLLTAKGRSSSDPVFYDGTTIENPTQSRRVVFKFTLRDAEMIQQMNTLLKQNYGPGAYQIQDPTQP